MLIDMHLHERTFSLDSHLSLEQIVTIAKAKGLDGVCITDHDSMGLRSRAEEYSRETGFPILVGVEFYSLQGDITAWGVDSCPPERVDAQAFIDQVNAAGGFCAACHPFRNNNRGLEEHLRKVHGLHGIEVLNGSTSPEANQKALRYCRELGCTPIGGSDAHIEKQVGVYATWLPREVHTLEEFISLLRAGQTKPARWTGQGYEVLDEF